MIYVIIGQKSSIITKVSFQRRKAKIKRQTFWKVIIQDNFEEIKTDINLHTEKQNIVWGIWEN